jgi:tRNA-splicing ligase RtcB
MAREIVEGIPVFGAPLMDAVAQIKAIAADAERVALMADHHLGYSMPIGGVAAYDGKVSPSGVGYDIGCFTGDTKVALADGRSLSFEDLIREDAEGKTNFVFCLDEKNSIALRPLASPRQTRETSSLVSVMLDNGEIIRCTPDHIFYTRDGQQVQAQHLEVGMSLMPLYLSRLGDVPAAERAPTLKKNKLADYTAVYNPADSLYRLVHLLADECNLDSGVYQEDEHRRIRHHRDFNKLNNNPTNIERMNWREHLLLHGAHAREAIAEGRIGFGVAHRRDPEFFSKMGSDNMKALHQRPDFRERHLERAHKNLEKAFESPAWEKVSAEAGQRNKHHLIAFNQSEEGRKQASENACKPHRCSRCELEFENKSAWAKHHHAVHRSNHKVASIRTIELDSPIPAYCLTVPDHHNFALASGVFVHNCGNKAVLLDADAVEVKGNIKAIMDDIWRSISFGVGRKNAEAVDHPLFDDDPAWDIPVAGKLKQLARDQLGTVGGGNHYVDLFIDSRGRVWCGVHFGSRGLGHKLATHFVAAGGGRDGMFEPAVLLDAGTPLGDDYIACMELAGRYAYAGRDWACRKVASILGANILDEVHNHHNFAWMEEHGGRRLWVVRKGATPAFPGQRGFVGGSMGEVSVILEGVDGEASREALYSTVHGAGRVMGRREAAGKFKWKAVEPGRPRQYVQVAEGKVSRSMMDEWVGRAGVELRGAGTDESPHCYKRLPDVLAAHDGTIRILETLKPIGVAMAGSDEHDPYKD